MLSKTEYFKSGSIKIGGVAVEIGEGDILAVSMSYGGRVKKERLEVTEIAYANDKPYMAIGWLLTARNTRSKRYRGKKWRSVGLITGIIEKGYFAEIEER